jgi:hypothetical protein
MIAPEIEEAIALVEVAERAECRACEETRYLQDGGTLRDLQAGDGIGPIQAEKKLANLYDYLTEHRQSFGR